MCLHLQICCNDDGKWSITGLPDHEAIEFADLGEGLQFAKRKCASAPALIELYSNGFYAAVSQEEGWPHQICRPVSYRRGGSRPADDRLHRCAEQLATWYHRCFGRRRRGSQTAADAFAATGRADTALPR
jgi:hypothetical protein